MVKKLTTFRAYPAKDVARQPIGYWTGEAHKLIVGRIRHELATENLTQPHWWILNHLASEPAVWSTRDLGEKLRRFDDLAIDFDSVFDDLLSRVWIVRRETGLELTSLGEEGFRRARDRNMQAHREMLADIDRQDHAQLINVLRRIIANLGGDSDLPE